MDHNTPRIAAGQRVPGFLDRIANVAIVVTCMMLCAYLGKSMLTKQAPTVLSTDLASVYKPGDKIGNTSSLRFDTSKLTVVLVTASTCHFCTESMPFYETLYRAAHDKGVRVVNITFEDPDQNRKYFLSHGITIDMPARTADTSVRVKGTPTLLLVRTDGTVVGSWFGKLGDAGESEVLKAVGSS